MRNANRILVITLSNIGDVVLSLPVLGALKQNFRYAAIDVVVGARAKEVFEVDPRIERMYIYDKASPLAQKLKFLMELKRKRYDLVVDMRDGLLGFFLGFNLWVGSVLNPARGVTHKVDAHLHKLKISGLKMEPNAYPVWINQMDADHMAGLLERYGISASDELVCVSPGARSHIKRWGEDGFARVCDKLIEERKVKVVFVGDEGDVQICRRITNRMKNYAVSVSGQTNIRQLAWCIKRSRLLITNDSAPLHIACSVGTPVVAIFGPTDFRKYGPRQGQGFAVHKKLHCSPCGAAQCRYNLECMKAVEPAEVLYAAQKILEGQV